MKQIVPFNKEITFKTMISKITSISLEHTLELKDKDTIEGDFIVSGTYKMTDASQIDEDFSYKIPIEITIDSKYDTSNISLEIDDFVYEVIDEEKLLLKIDLCIDNLELVDTDKEDIFDDIMEDYSNTIDNSSIEPIERCIDENEVEDLFLDTSKEEKLEIPKEEDTSNIDNNYQPQEENPNYQPTTNQEEPTTNSEPSIFSAFKDTTETFATYYIYIIREGDSLDTVLNKYNTTRDVLSLYNDLSDIRIGSKIIIPNKNE